MSVPEEPGLGAIRRVVTGHDEAGRAVVLFDGANPHVRLRPGRGNASRLFWTTRERPADIGGATDRAEGHHGTGPHPLGSILRVVDFPPTPDAALAAYPMDALAREHGGLHDDARRPPSHPFMHRTDSVDYAIVLSGRIEMKLDEEWVSLAAGDVVVQRATNHAWQNRTDQWCRVAFVLLGTGKTTSSDET